MSVGNEWRVVVFLNGHMILRPKNRDDKRILHYLVPDAAKIQYNFHSAKSFEEVSVREMCRID